MNVTLACTLIARLRGLLGDRSEDGVLLLAPCNDVHTFGMKQPIDVAFVDMSGMILASYRRMQPRKRIRCKGAVATLERYSKDDSWFSEGEKVSLRMHGRGEGRR